MGLGKVLYELTGLTTRNYRVNLCTNFGQRLTKKISQGSNPTNADVSEFLRENLSKKNFGKVNVTTDKKVTEQFLIDEMCIKPEQAAKMVENSTASVAHGKNGKKLLSLNKSTIDNSEQAGIVAHELQHLFTSQTALPRKIDRLLEKLFPKSIQKAKEKYAGIINEKNVKLYRKVATIASKSELGDEKEIMEELRKCIRGHILLPDCNKNNAVLLRTISSSMRNEARSYKVQGEITGNQKWKNVSKVMELASKVAGEEASKQRFNNIKKFFGLKPKEYKIELQEEPEALDFIKYLLNKARVVDGGITTLKPIKISDIEEVKYCRKD